MEDVETDPKRKEKVIKSEIKEANTDNGDYSHENGSKNKTITMAGS